MKKRIISLLIICLLFITGCTCQYNLKIENDTFKEEIVITISDASEQNAINKEYKIPIDKEVYNYPGDEGGNNYNDAEIYDYKIGDNNVTFSHDFSFNTYSTSSAISECYDTITATNYSDSIVISTSNKANCFDKYPTLTSLTIRIIVDKEVVNHNADSVSDKTYIWNLNRNNADNKPVNMVLKKNSLTSSSNNSSKPIVSNTPHKRDYTLYIFCGVLLIVVLIGYLIYLGIKKNEQNMGV